MLDREATFNFLTKISETASQLFRHPDQSEDDLMDWYDGKLFRHARDISRMGGLEMRNELPKNFEACVEKFDQDLGYLDRALRSNGQSYLCGANITPSDLLIYCEIFTALTILPRDTIKIEIYGQLHA